MFYRYRCCSSLCLSPRNRRTKQPTSVARPNKVLNNPQLGRGPPLGTVLFVKYLDISWVYSFEFSLDTSDARCTRRYRRGLRTRFYMIVYQLFYTCIVKGYNSGLQQWCDWRGYNCANLPPNKLNKKLSLCFIFLYAVFFFLVFSKLLFYAFSVVFGLLFSGDFGF